MLAVDANHWIYFVDPSLREHASVEASLPRLVAEEPLVMTAVVQMEVAHYVGRVMPDVLETVLEQFFGLDVAAYEPLDAAGVLAALGRMQQHRRTIGSRDAHLLYAAKKHGASLLLTSDKALAKAARAEGLAVRDLAR
ncbi:MAG: type II toxin-antitoxin system VapC family toxin [Halobacteriales archaeon]|nr:type II toxin-antitoxin system VapC family toxin [Halobacteriales archaeon]